MHGFGLYTGIRSTVKWPANRYSVMYNHTSRLCSPEVQNVSCVIGVTHTSPHWPSPHSRHSSVRSHWTPRAPHPIISCLLQKLAHICSLWQLLPQDFDRANWFLVPHFSIAFDNKHWALNTHNKKLVVSVVRPWYTCNRQSGTCLSTHPITELSLSLRKFFGTPVLLAGKLK